MLEQIEPNGSYLMKNGEWVKTGIPFRKEPINDSDFGAPGATFIVMMDDFYWRYGDGECQGRVLFRGRFNNRSKAWLREGEKYRAEIEGRDLVHFLPAEVVEPPIQLSLF